MAPDVNWNALESIIKSDVQSEDDQIMENGISMLRDIDENEYQEDVEKLLMLVKVGKKALDYREFALSEILQDHEAEIDQLKREIDEEKKFGSAKVPKDAEFYRIENRRLLEQKDSYIRQNDELSQENNKLTEERNKFEQEAEDGRRIARELRSEIQDLRLNLRDYQSIIDKQNLQRVTTGADTEVQEKLNERNKQISDLLTQITELEKVNRDLEEGTQKLKQEMESGQQEMEKMVDEYEKMRKVIGVSDKYADDLQKQNAQLKMQVADMRDDLLARRQDDDAITAAVNEKVEEWTARIRERDQENDEYRRTIATLKAKITTSGLDQDRLNVEKLTKKLEASRAEVAELKAALAQAVSDLEEQTAIVEDLRKDLGTNRETLAYKAQIRNLQDQVNEYQSLVKDAESRRGAAESDAQENDFKLAEALKRITLLESGQYGLTEAVNEIKDCKAVMRDRDREIRELTKITNQLEEKISDFIEENEEFRERLGIDPRNLDDIVQLRKNRALRQQQFRAENQILLKEIEDLEEERISLKKQIRRQAQSQIQKASDEGLDSDDLTLIEEFVDEVIRLRKRGIKDNKIIIRGSLITVDKPKETDASIGSKVIERLLTEEKLENVRLKKELDDLLYQNEEFQTALKEIANELKNEDKWNRLIKIKSLDRLVDLLEEKRVTKYGKVDLSEMDQLRGRNDELRNELKCIREEQVALSSENSALSQQVIKLQTEAEAVFARKKLNLALLSLPSDVEPQSGEVITAMQEQLIQVLNDCEMKTKHLNETKEALENSRRQLQVVRHQTHTLYKEHYDSTQEWDAERKKLIDQKEVTQEKLDKSEVRLEEYDRLLIALKDDPDEMKRKLAETSRKVSLLRVNEKTLIRRHKALEVAEETLSLENERFRREIGMIERAVAEKISYLERHKAMNAFKLESLQKALETSVPESDLSALNRRFDELTIKYRNLLQKESQDVANTVKMESLKEELKISLEKCEALRGELSIEKGKRITMEEALKKSNVSLVMGNSDSLLQKVTVLEMKELNERQKAEHASRMYKRIKEAMDDVQRRNSELESKFAQLTELNLIAQQTERDLRDELADAVPKSVSDAERKKISLLEEELARTKVKLSKVQDLSDISHNQLKTVQAQQHARDRELKSLRQQVREFQVQDDKNSLIGKLNHQILNLQSTEEGTQRKLDKAEKNVAKLETYVLKLEKQLDGKDDAVYLTRIESHNKVRQLRKTIQSLRQRFSGALPLAQQEKFSAAMIRLQGDKVLIREELRRVRIEREKLEDKLGETEIEKASLEELRQAIKDNRGADKLTEWSARIDKLRLQDMKLQRLVMRQGEEIKYLENINTDHEKTVASLEEDIVELLKAQEEHQVEWEMREMELERLLDQFQSRQLDVVKKARRLEDITQTIPDPSLPIEVQLTRALQIILDQAKVVTDLRAFVKTLQFENERLKDVRHNLEGDVTSRDRVINELRLHMPTTSTVTKATVMDSDSQKQLRVAMETIETLKKRLQAKEEALARHKELIEEARKEQEVADSSHERQLVLMQEKLHQRTNEAFSHFKNSALDGLSPRRAPKQESHVVELENVVREQDAALAALMDRVRAANADVTKQKQNLALLRKQTETERNNLLDEQESSMNAIRLKLAKKQQKVETLEKELEYTKEELEKQKEANARAPSNTMKSLLARLKQQLQEKEVQQQKLSHALTELRADLVDQAQENVRAHNVNEVDSGNVKILVNKRTAQYKFEIEELKDKIAELQRGVKQAKQTEEALRNELRKILEEAERKEQTIRRLKFEIRGKDSDVSQLRDKVKRLVKSKGPNPGRNYIDEEPVKLRSVSGEEGPRKMVHEETVVPVDAASEQGSRPSSAKQNLNVPRSHLADQAKIEKLRSELSRFKSENENLKEKLNELESTKSNVEVAKWEVKKTWQNKVEQLKTKLQDKEKLAETLEKQVNSLRETISRLERDKARRSALPIGPPIHAQGTLENSIDPRNHAVRQHLHKIEELSSRLHQLGDENKDLREKAVLPQKRLIAETEEKNRILSNKLDELQKEIMSSGYGPDALNLSEQFGLRESELQGRILKLSSENAQLLFELEQVKLDVPRLQERLEYQQKYIDLLQAEKKEVQSRVTRIKSHPDKQPTIQGTSGKSVVELEKTVALMKKVVERVQRENDQLKKAPGVVSNQKLDELQTENQNLKKRLHEVTQQIGGQLSRRYESKTESVEKMVADNQRLRKDLNRQSSAKDKMRMARDVALEDKEKLKKELEAIKKKLAIAESKAPNLVGAGSKGYNSAVTAKMLEAKLKKSEEKLNQQGIEMDALKVVLKEKDEEERNLRNDNKKLYEQIEVLERFPPNAGGADPSTVRELQLARLSVARLENEKEELQHQIEMLKKTDVTAQITSTENDSANRAEILRLESEVKLLNAEKKVMEERLDQQRKELSNFDGDFFDEIEDLKYNYAQSMKRNVMYEEQLRALSRQFGVSVDIPSSDSEA